MQSKIHLLAFSGVLSISIHTVHSINPSYASSKTVTSFQHQSGLVAALNCKEWKKRNGATGKAAADDAPSWVINEGHKPCKTPNEDGKTFAQRVLEGKYGVGNCPTGPGSEYNKTQKYGDRSFE
jgi:hypothetical protein